MSELEIGPFDVLRNRGFRFFINFSYLRFPILNQLFTQMIRLYTLALVLFLFGHSPFLHGQENKDSSDLSLNALSFRSIGPAMNGGRIADIAVHPDNENVWYVAVGSGHVWKTTNAGTTWKPIFDGQDVY